MLTCTCWSPWVISSVDDNVFHLCSIHGMLTYLLLWVIHIPLLEQGAWGSRASEVLRGGRDTTLVLWFGPLSPSARATAPS